MTRKTSSVKSGSAGYALSLFRQAHEVDPELDWARANLILAQSEVAQLQAMKGQLGKAEEILSHTLELSKACKDDTMDDTVRAAIGNAYVALARQYHVHNLDYGHAIETARKAREFLPDDPEAWFVLDEILIESELPARLSDYSDRVAVEEFGTHILVACFPKSGSTFLRYALAVLTGFPTRNFVFSHGRNETALYLPQLIQGARENTITQIHMRAADSNINLMQAFCIRPIILVRNIFDVLLSYKEHYDKYATSSTFYAKYPDLSEEQRMDLIIDDRATWYIGFFAGWQRAIQAGRIDGLWLTYESLMTEKVEKIDDIMRFYGIEKSREQIGLAVDMIEAEKVASRFNRGVSGRGQSRFTDAHKAQIRRIAAYHPDIDFSLIGL